MVGGAFQWWEGLAGEQQNLGVQHSLLVHNLVLMSTSMEHRHGTPLNHDVCCVSGSMCVWCVWMLCYSECFSQSPAICKCFLHKNVNILNGYIQCRAGD